MKTTLTFLLALLISSAAHAGGDAVSYKVNGQPYEGYFISPSSDAPLVLLIHDWDGLTDYEVRRSEMLAKLGYAVFAVDLFGAGVRPKKLADKRQHTGELYADRKKMRALVQGALDAAKDKGADIGNAVAMGYCFGGAAVLEFARAGADLKGFVTFHGGLKTPKGQGYDDAKGRMLILHGEADTAIPMTQFAALGDELDKAGIKNEMISYAGAPHGFTVFGSGSYRKEADEQSWKKFGKFLGKVLK